MQGPGTFEAVCFALTEQPLRWVFASYRARTGEPLPALCRRALHLFHRSVDAAELSAAFVGR
jgi:hypothetical protein